MGQSVSELRKQATHDQAQNEQKQKFVERLQILEKMIEQRLEIVKIDILNGEKNNQEIDTGTIVSLHKVVHIKVGEKESDRDELSKAIHQLFSDDFISGLESIVELGAETVLGNDSMGEYESKDMFIVWNDNALLRCDAYYYRWNFVSKSVIDETEGVTGCLLVKRVIDLTKTDPQVLTWVITRMTDRINNAEPKPSKPVDPQELISDALKVLEKVVEFQAKIKAIAAGRKPEIVATPNHPSVNRIVANKPSNYNIPLNRSKRSTRGNKDTGHNRGQNMKQHKLSSACSNDFNAQTIVATEDHTGNSSNQEPEVNGNENAGSNSSTSRTAIIAGDSMVKHLNGYKMSTRNLKIQVSTFPGCSTLDMEDYLKPIIRKKPDKLVIHVGTNSLRETETPEKCADEIANLAKQVINACPQTTVALSSIVTRSDDKFLAAKAIEVNLHLKQACHQNHWSFIDHSNIKPTHLNRSGIHLNKAGTLLMARNFTSNIYNRNR